MRSRAESVRRQEAFLQAGTELFMEKGYENVSVRDVLNAVGDKTVSPSVFYYYYSSKDALYKACVSTVAQDYLSSVKDCLSADGKSTEEKVLALITAIEQYMLNERNLILTGESVPNRLFILDMREQLTEQIISMWTEMPLPEGEAPSNDGPAGRAEADAGHMDKAAPDADPVDKATANVLPADGALKEACRLSRFLMGGISEMLFSFTFEKERDRAAVWDLTESILDFCMNTMGLPQERKIQLRQALKDQHRQE